MSRPHHHRRSDQRRGFSLLELLVVLAGMAILLSLVASVTNSSVRASRISEAAGGLADTLANASMEAVRTNRPVHFRLYRFVDPDYGAEATVRAYQSLVLDTGSQSYLPISPLVRLPVGVVIHDDTTASTLLTLPETTPHTVGGTGTTVADPELDGLGGYTYYDFEFRPDGSTNLPKDSSWGILVTFAPDSSFASAPIGKDYRALTINPFTGAVRKY